MSDDGGFSRTDGGFSRTAPPTADLLPARKTPDGYVIVGKPGDTHAILPGGAPPESERGFVRKDTGQFLRRKGAGTAAQGAGADVPKTLHSEDLPDQGNALHPSWIDNSLAPIRDIVPTYKTKVGESVAEMKGGVKRIGKGEVLGGAKDAALGALGYVSAPIDAPVEALLSKPMEKATGIPKDYTTLATELFAPAGITKAAKLAKPMAEGLKSATTGTTVEKMLSPTTVDAAAGRTEGFIRSAIGKGERDTATTQARLSQSSPVIAKMADTDRLDLIDYIENRSKGARIPDPKLQRVADDIRDANKLRLTKYQALPSTQKAGFIEDYFVHEWENPKQAQQFVYDWVGKQGSGRNLKAREIPTIADGLRAGLKLKTTDPIEATVRYAANMDRYLAINETVDNMRAAGEAKYFKPGAQPAGWMEMKGRLGQKITPAGPMKLYAPEGAATVFNNFISRGFADIGPNAGKAFDAVQHAANTVTSLKLGLSGFHATTMANEAVINDVARAIGQAGRGDLLRAAKTAGMAVTAPVNTYRRGSKLIKEYLGQTQLGGELGKIADLAGDANARFTKRDPSMFASTKGSYWSSYQRGTLGKELKDSLNTALTVKGFVPETWKQASRLLDTVASPLFDKYIPTIKAGAFYDNMADWLRAHPNASVAEQKAAARTVWDSIDNRFGELVQDNLFWNKTGKQVAQVLTLSPTWNIGTVREIGGGVKDIAAGKGLTERAKYVMALPIVTGLTGSILQYLRTGQAPDDKTLLGLYKTGGTNYDGSDERAMVPGYMKDVLGYSRDPLGEVGNKMNPALSLGVDLMRNKDYRGLPIANPTNEGTFGERMLERGQYIGEQALPISIGQFLHRKEGGAITPLEQSLGVRAAPMIEQNPERIEGMTEKIARRDWKRKQRADRRAKNREEK